MASQALTVSAGEGSKVETVYFSNLKVKKMKIKTIAEFVENEYDDELCDLTLAVELPREGEVVSAHDFFVITAINGEVARYRTIPISFKNR